MSYLLRATFFTIFILHTISLNSYAFFGNDEPIKLDQVPKAVMKVAKKQLENFIPESAEKETTRKYVEYEIEGSSNKKRYSIHIKVNKAGDIIDVKVEEEDD